MHTPMNNRPKPRRIPASSGACCELCGKEIVGKYMYTLWDLTACSSKHVLALLAEDERDERDEALNSGF